MDHPILRAHASLDPNSKFTFTYLINNLLWLNRCWSTVAITTSWWIRIGLLWTSISRTSTFDFVSNCLLFIMSISSNVFQEEFVHHRIHMITMQNWLLAIEPTNRRNVELLVVKNKRTNETSGCFCILFFFDIHK